MTIHYSKPPIVDLEARADYETAAKIEIYKQNKEDAISCLKLAEAVSEEQQHQETMLADIDGVLRIYKAYQSSIPQWSSSAQIS